MFWESFEIGYFQQLIRRFKLKDFFEKRLGERVLNYEWGFWIYNNKDVIFYFDFSKYMLLLELGY